MKRSTLIKSFLGFYLGFMVTALFGANLSDWRWWVFVIPTILLTEWATREQSKEN